MSSQSEEVRAARFEQISGLAVAIQGLQSRLDHIEFAEKKSIFRRLTENASAAALLIGLALTVAQVRETFFSKPEADRIAQIGAFNQSIGAVAKLRQEMAELNYNTSNPSAQLTVASILTARIVNEVSTARAMLHDIKDADVGIPQLVTLISEAFNEGDLATVDLLTSRTVNKKDVTAFAHSEAMRYRAKYLFINQTEQGRNTMEAAIALLPLGSGAQAFDVRDLLESELGFGDCDHIDSAAKRLLAAVATPQIYPEQRNQVLQSIIPFYNLVLNGRCPTLPPLRAPQSK